MLSFQAGDVEAFDGLVLEFRDAVFHFIRRYLSDNDRAEDLTQEVFLRVFRARQSYQPTAGFRTWLFTIATRLAFNEIRGVRRRRRHFSESARGAGRSDDPEMSLAELTADFSAQSPHDRLEQQELKELIDAWIERLPAGQRAAILLSRAEELSYHDIAGVLGISVTAVKSLLMRARESLRRKLRPYLESGQVRSRPALPDSSER